MSHSRREFIEQTIGAGIALGAVFRSLAAEERRDANVGHVSGAELPMFVLTHPSGAEVQIYYQGAHVTSWKRADGEEMLFLSEKSQFAPHQPIRGGIPVVFPQFANLGSLPSHGFLRTMDWKLTESGADHGESVSALFETSDSQETRALWPHSFRAQLRLTLDDALRSRITIENTGTSAFDFACALHTYHRVGDVRRVTIGGLEDASYRDRTAAEALRAGSHEPLGIQGEVDRIYLNQPRHVTIHDPSRGRTVTVEREGFEDVVIWNPGETKARSPIGLAEGEYLTMLAVEAAQVARRISLAPGKRWFGAQRISVAG